MKLQGYKGNKRPNLKRRKEIHEYLGQLREFLEHDKHFESRLNDLYM